MIIGRVDSVADAQHWVFSTGAEWQTIKGTMLSPEFKRRSDVTWLDQYRRHGDGWNGPQYVYDDAMFNNKKSYAERAAM